MSNESLDNIFKKGLSKRNVGFNMESWQRMEGMLPPEKKPKGMMYGASSLIIGAVVLLGAAVYILSATDVIPDSNQKIEIADNTVLEREDESFSENANTTYFDKEHTNSTEPQEQSNQGIITEQGGEYESEVVQGIDNKDVENEYAENKYTENEEVNVNAYSVEKDEANSGLDEVVSSFSQEENASTTAEKRSRKTNSEINESTDELASKNLFTKILGVGELSTLLLQEEEEHTIIANTSNSLPKMDKNEFGFIGGVNINKSLVDASSEIAVSEMFGVTYQRYLNGGFSIKSNLLYTARNGVNTQKLEDKKVYGFGSVTEQTLVESQRLIYVELPIMANYSIGNHNIMGGASFSYLVSCLNKETTETKIQSESPTYSEATKWTGTDGFNPYDFSLVAGYEYNVKSNLNIGLRLNYGLLDVTKNSYFGTDSFDNNVQFRVYLTYSPFKF